jgi:ABC-2 type transport system ATP-binding protein
MTKQIELEAAAIVVEHVTKQFGNFTAVDDVSFEVHAGETFGLLGPNGAGKSSLIRMITTLIPITRGCIKVVGHDVALKPNQARLAIGVIPQALTTDTDLSVEDNLSIYAKLYGVEREARNRAIRELLELVGLSDWRHSNVGKLSGGMRRRVEIARGLVHSPRVLFLDEPTTGLDPGSRVDVWEMLEKIQDERQLTIFLTTHYMEEADRLCDRIAIVDHGHLIALGTPEQLKASVHGTTLIVAQFQNAPADWNEQLRLLPGVTSAENAGPKTWRVLSDDGSCTTTAIVERARQKEADLSAITVESTSLNDVFTHYTGRSLRTMAQSAAENN